MSVSLIGFLTARLNEEELVAREAISDRQSEIARGVYRPGLEPRPDCGPPIGWDDWSGGPGVRMGAERLMADVAAKRAILRFYGRLHFPDPLRQGPFWSGQWEALNAVLLELAQAYADHPDFDPVWAA